LRTSILARRLKEARLKSGLTQEGLGVLAGIDEFSASARMNQYERGKHSPHYQTMVRLAAALNVSVTYFYSGDDQEAELLLLFAQLQPQQKETALEFIRQLTSEGA
jgi:transcriptional regulator with XRE-family HTH domain